MQNKLFIKILVVFIITISFFSCKKNIKDKPKVINKNKIVQENSKANVRPIQQKVKDPDEFTVLCMGDLLIANIAEQIMLCNGLDYPFKKLENEFKKYDIVFANLETSITKRGKPHAFKPFVFRLNPKNAKYLRKLKIDVISIANNHILDYGKKGLYDTIKFLKGWGVKYCGAGWNLYQARKPARLKRKKTNVSFLAYCGRPPEDFYAKKKKPGIAPQDIRIIRKDIKKLKRKNNLVFISLHWGLEHTEYPAKYQRKLAKQIIDAGADGIIGHHPHIPQGIEIYKDKPIIYSLGNVISGFYHPNYKDNIMVALHYKKNVLTKLDIIPIAGENGKMHFQPYVLKGEKALTAISKINYLSRFFNTKIIVNNNIGNIYFNGYDKNQIIANDGQVEHRKNNAQPPKTKNDKSDKKRNLSENKRSRNKISLLKKN